MKDMKILDLLMNYLPNEYVDCVVNNLEDFRVLDDEGFSIEAELMSLFDWVESREGYEFWNQVFHYVIGEAELPPLPIDIDYKPSLTITMKDGMYIMNAGGTGLNIKYEIIMKDLHKAEKKAQEQLMMWLN
jgi:hypothetical protein